MRLRRLTIKNFRSISGTGIEDFEFVDLGITTFIGGNGTGKSNILKAICCLDKDAEGPSDEDFYAKGRGTDDEILIKAEFLFEEKDKSILKSKNLSPKNINGFYVHVEKKRTEEPTISFEAICYKDERGVKIDSTLIDSILEDIKKVTTDLELPSEAESAKTKILAEVNVAFSQIVPDYEKIISNISEGVTELNQFNPEGAKKISDFVEKIEKLATTDMLESLEGVFDTFDIELLTMEGYEIKNKAPISELNDNSKHPFLYDLLVLAGTKASEFEPVGSPILKRIERRASQDLSEKISKVWVSHEIKFAIDREGEELLFTVFTKQDQQIGLTDLSEGEKWFLRYYTRLAISELEGKQVLWLFDEPGRDLHSSSQIDLKKFFEDISQNSQIIYTTHQAMMVPWHRLERIFVVENYEDAGTIVHKRFWKDTRLESPLKEALSTFVGEELFSGKEHIIVEGMSDYFYLQGWLRFFQKSSDARIWRESFEPLERVMLPVDGIAKIPLYCWFLGRQVRNKVNWVAIVDSKEEQETTRSRLEDTGLGSWKNNAVCIGDLAKMNDAESIEEIENLFKPEEYIGVFHDYYKEEYPTVNITTENEIKAKLSNNKENRKITKVITQLLKEKNPPSQIDAKPIELDKTGIARKVYLILTREKELPFSKETQSNFENVLRNTSKMLPKEKRKIGPNLLT